MRRGLHVSEYGVAGRRDRLVRGRARARYECTSCSAWAYIEPELREDRGELAAALADFGAADGPRALCRALIELDDIRGDLHTHTVASDGHNTISEMARGGAVARL